MNIEVLQVLEIKNYENLNLQEFKQIYGKNDLNKHRYALDKIIKGYSKSLYLVGAFLDNKLIGICRVVGDGETIIYIQDLLVLDEYRTQGIESLMLQDVLNKFKNVNRKVIISRKEENKVELYKSVGFYGIENYGANCYVNFIE